MYDKIRYKLKKRKKKKKKNYLKLYALVLKVDKCERAS